MYPRTAVAQPQPNRLSPLAAALLLVLPLLATPAHAAPAVAHWTVTDLGSLVGGGGTSYATGINAAGQVVGWSGASTDTRAFLWQNGAMTDLGVLPGGFDLSVANGINAAGQVVGDSGASTSGRAFLWQNGSMTDLGDLHGGLDYSHAYGINDAGQVVGNSGASTSGRAFLWQNGVMTDLGVLPGGSLGYSVANGINDAGQVVGGSHTSTSYRAFLWQNGTMTDLGDLPGGFDLSVAYGINAVGQVVGYSEASTGNRAFLWQNGTMTDLGDLPGGSDFSLAYGINDAGQVVGYSAVSTGPHAFLWQNGVMTDLNSLNGAASSGFTMADARAINDLGQIVGWGTNSGGVAHGYVLALDTTVWESGYSSSWEYAANWSYGTAPNHNTHAIIDPTRSLTVYGPSGNAEVKRLTVGTDNSGGGGIATLTLNGGKISAVGDDGSGNIGWQGVWIGQNGVLTGDGVLSVDASLGGAVFNYGKIVADNVRVASANNPSNALIYNRGLIVGNKVGSARIVSNYVTNESTGRIQVMAGERLHLEALTSNAGSIEVRGGGQFENTGSFINQNGGQVLVEASIARFNTAANNYSGGRVSLNDGTVYFNGGLSNSGQMLVTYGESSVFGTVTTNTGGKIILSGNSDTTFYDAVEVKSGGELRVSTGSTGVFFGLVTQRTGALFTGAGSKFYEGGLTIGGSPGLGLDGGNVSFGAGNTYLAEIGGTSACTALCDSDEAIRNSSHDKYVVSGLLTLDGSLKLTSWNGYIGQAGDSFDLFDWGTLTGTFASIDSTGFLLADGTTLDFSNLYVDGSVRVAAVPEPESYALMLAGMGLVGLAARRRKNSGQAQA